MIESSNKVMKWLSLSLAVVITLSSSPALAAGALKPPTIKGAGTDISYNTPLQAGDTVAIKRASFVASIAPKVQVIWYVCDNVRAKSRKLPLGECKTFSKTVWSLNISQSFIGKYLAVCELASNSAGKIVSCSATTKVAVQAKPANSPVTNQPQPAKPIITATAPTITRFGGFDVSSPKLGTNIPEPVFGMSSETSITRVETGWFRCKSQGQTGLAFKAPSDCTHIPTLNGTHSYTVGPPDVGHFIATYTSIYNAALLSVSWFAYVPGVVEPSPPSPSATPAPTPTSTSTPTAPIEAPAPSPAPAPTMITKPVFSVVDARVGGAVKYSQGTWANNFILFQHVFACDSPSPAESTISTQPTGCTLEVNPNSIASSATGKFLMLMSSAVGSGGAIWYSVRMQQPVAGTVSTPTPPTTPLPLQKKAQVLSFTPPASLTVGQQYRLTATVNSGLLLAVSANSACSYDAATGLVSANYAGTCSLAINQWGDTTWQMLPGYSVNIPVVAKALTVHVLAAQSCPATWVYKLGTGFVDFFTPTTFSADGLKRYHWTVISTRETSGGFFATGKLETYSRASTSLSFYLPPVTTAWVPPVLIKCSG